MKTTKINNNHLVFIINIVVPACLDEKLSNTARSVLVKIGERASIVEEVAVNLRQAFSADWWVFVVGLIYLPFFFFFFFSSFFLFPIHNNIFVLVIYE
jgi:hypothetical protein